MYKELNLFNSLDSLDDNKLLFMGLKHDIAGVVVCPTNVPLFKEFLPAKIKLVCMVDYPYGFSTSLARQHSCIEAIKHGATDIDIVINHNYFKAKDLTKIKKDLQSLKDICKERDCNLRILVESRLLEEKDLISVIRGIYNMGFREFLLTTNCFIEDYSDNLILASVLQKKFSDIKIICTGDVWKEDQYKSVLKSNVYGLRLNSARNLSFLKVYN